MLLQVAVLGLQPVAPFVTARYVGLTGQHHQVDDFFDYIKALVGTLMDSQLNTHLHSDDWQRTIYIDTLGVGTTDFDMSETMKAMFF